MLCSATVGAVAMLLPCTIFCATTTHAKEVAEKKAEDAVTELGMRQSKWIYLLAKNIEAGEVITEDDLIGAEVFTEEGRMRAMTNSNEIIGKRAKCNLGVGTVLQEDLLYEGEAMTDDLRSVTVTYASLPTDLAKGDRIDLRIFFPDGEDFVVLAKKKVEAVVRNENEEATACTLELNEEELLLLAGAYVDSRTITDVKIYALCYVSETQKAAKVNYPVNKAVFDLVATDPNVQTALLGKANEKRRTTLEENLGAQAGKEYLGSEEAPDREEISALFGG